MMSQTDYEAFCDASWHRLVTGLTHHLGDLLLAEDAAQEALIRAGVRWSRVRQSSSPLGWTFRVGANYGVSQIRRRGAERRAVSRLVPTPSSDPLASVELSDVLQNALAALPEHQRRTVIARYYFDLTVGEVASEFNISQGAVRASAHRGIERLRELVPQVSTPDEEE